MAEFSESSFRHGVSDEYKGESSLHGMTGLSEYGTSDEYIDPWCDPCENENKYVSVFSYCPTCVEFFCKRCHESHKNFSITRNHTIKYGSDIPKSQAEKPVKFPLCGKHATVTKELYCMDHKTLICSTCQNEHIGCKVYHANHIGIVVASDVNEIENKIEDFRKVVLMTMSSLKKNLVDIREEKDVMMDTARKKYKELELKLHHMFKETTKCIDEKYSKEAYKLSNIIETLKNGMTRLDSITEDIKKSKTCNMNTNLFVKLQRSIEDTREIVRELNETTEECDTIVLEFHIDQELSSYLSERTEIGKPHVISTPFEKAVPTRDLSFPTDQLRLLQREALHTDVGKLVSLGVTVGHADSGFAYSFCSGNMKDQIMIQTKALTDRYTVNRKTPFCILISPEKTFKAFGYDAEAAFEDLACGGKHYGYYFFRHLTPFPMNDEERQVSLSDIMATDETGKRLPAVTVFSLGIKYLLKEAINFIRHHHEAVLINDLSLVLSVEDAWYNLDLGKQFFREAALKSGLDLPDLHIVSSLQAATMFCLESLGSHHQAAVLGKQYLHLCFQDCSTYIAIGKFTDTFLPTVLRVADVFEAGLAQILQALECLFAELCGQDAYQELREHSAFRENWHDNLRTFLLGNRSWENEYVTLSTGNELREALLNNKQNQSSSGKLSEFFNDIRLIADKIRIKTVVVKSLFDPTINQVVRHVEILLKDRNRQDIETLFVTGDLSRSVLLQNAIKETFRDMTVVFSDNPGMEDMKGAAILGHKLCSSQVIFTA